MAGGVKDPYRLTSPCEPVPWDPLREKQVGPSTAWLLDEGKQSLRLMTILLAYLDQ